MIAIGSDHAGFMYKENLKRLLDELGLTYRDYGTNSPESTDYPDFAHKVATAVSNGEATQGVLICGTGIGMSIVANRHKGVRAAVCESVEAARLAREHNNANVLTFGARITPWDRAEHIVRIFFTTAFDGGERHRRRIQKIDAFTNL
jgi:ribose 5-phosphate isomerase B